MGTMQREYLIIQTGDYDQGLKKVDSFISKLPKEFASLFFKCPCIMNGCLTYFMNWDGSKEGWDVSNKADVLRKKFIDLIRKNFNCVDILHIKPAGEVYQTDSILRYKK